jgi:isoquinoline 1-oxidoreductase subunit alpha
MLFGLNLVMKLSINSKAHEVTPDPSEMLLWVLRDTLGLTGTKFGCGAGICGSCTVHVDGMAMRSCMTPVTALENKQIRTVEGLASGEELHPVQQAFINEQVPQCAWCMNGQVMTAAAFLEQTPNPNEEDIINAMSNNYCRCGCYARIRVAVAKASELMKEAL